MAIKVVSKPSKFSVFDLQKLSETQHMIFGADYVLIRPKTTGCTLHLADSYYRLNIGQLVLLAPFNPFRLSLDSDNPLKKIDCDVLHFRINGLGQTFTNSKQFSTVSKMLEQSRHALLYEGSETTKIGKMFNQIKNSFDFYYIVTFLNILDQLSKLAPKQALIKNCIAIKQTQKTEDKLDNALKYIQSHLAEAMTVSDAASSVYMAESTFSRFFHANMGLTFWQYVIEQRIRLATKQLISSDKSISYIAADVGFTSISCFNSKFKELLKLTPRQYREMHIDEKLTIGKSIKNKIQKQVLQFA